MKAIYAFSGRSKKIRKDKRRKRKKEEDNIKKNKVKTGYSAGSFDEEKTTQLVSRNETTQLNRRKQLNSAAGTKQLNSSVGMKQLNSALPSTACNRLHPPAPPLQQNRLFLPTRVTSGVMQKE
ncbi:hypothetical protein TNCV_2049811 [Trichonephila clavipes]|nr:hypothetical protein TNCV_2049811 [Trichonephila clavipes]